MDVISPSIKRNNANPRPIAPGSAPKIEEIGSLRLSLEHLKVMAFVMKRQVDDIEKTWKFARKRRKVYPWANQSQYFAVRDKGKLPLENFYVPLFRLTILIQPPSSVGILCIFILKPFNISDH